MIVSNRLLKLLAPLGGIALVAALWVAVPPPRHAVAQFVDQSTYGGTSGGTNNAQTITIANYTSHTAGVVLRFIPGSANTGPATINVSGLGAVAIQRPSSIGNVALSGGELQASELTCITYNGTAYQLACNVDMTPIGRTVEYRGAALPRGTLIEDGSAVSRTTYAPLFSVIGTTYGVGDGSTTFNLPLSNGSVFAALDNQGVTTSNRITSAGSGCNATAVGFCGLQSHTVVTPNLPPYTPVVTSATTQIPVYNNTNTSGSTVPNAIALANSGNASAGLYNPTVSGGGTVVVMQAQGGTSTPIPNLNPMLLGRRSIKY